MKSFRNFNAEAWNNGIGSESREAVVSKNMKFNSPTDYKANAQKVGQVGPLEIHSSDNGMGGMTHFTWSPDDRKIHHVVHAVEQSDTPDGGSQLKYLSAHGRKNSSVRMGDVYSSLVKNNGVQFVGTGHSEGAQKMWSRFHDDPDLEVVGRHLNGEEVPLNKNSDMYASKKTVDPNERKIGQMNLVLRKRQSGN